MVLKSRQIDSFEKACKKAYIKDYPDRNKKALKKWFRKNDDLDEDDDDMLHDVADELKDMYNDEESKKRMKRCINDAVEDLYAEKEEAEDEDSDDGWRDRRGGRDGYNSDDSEERDWSDDSDEESYDSEEEPRERRGGGDKRRQQQQKREMDRPSTGERMSFKSFNFPGNSMRHCNFEGFLHETEPDNEDFQFVLVAGLADRRKVSFESVNFPGHFMRHQGFRIKIHENDGSDLFQDDATFEMVRPKCGDAEGSEWMSFRSVNFPDRYLRHKNFELWLDPDEGGPFDADATFALQYEKTVCLRSLNFPGNAVRHRNFECFNDKMERNNDDFYFNIRPGLQEGLGVSFESVNFPNHFLRHCGFRLLLNEYDGSELFQSDATFAITRAIAGPKSHFSLNSVNFEEKFLRHRNFEMWLTDVDGPEEDFAFRFD